MADEDIDQEALKEAAEALREATADDAVSAGAGARQPGDDGDDGDVEDDAVDGSNSDDGGEASLESQLVQLQTELEQARDSAIRAQADAQNAQRRAEQDVEKARKFALERFCGELLPVVDNLERALETVDRDDASLKPIGDGVELTLKSFVGALQKFQIEQLDPEGEPFDPQLHQAMSMVENPDVEPNTVLTVMQKGYTLNGRLVRPAMVMVSKAPAA